MVVMGRRRVGKTFLINNAFEGDFVFKLTGSKDQTNAEQLTNFAHEISDRLGLETPTPANWSEAFRLLGKYLDSLPATSRLVAFIDELPWLDKAKSRFLPAFEYFWNHYGSSKRNLLLIVAGSSASWMHKKIVKNKGGLFDRQAAIMTIHPFRLLETEQFLQKKGISWSRMDIVRLYMVTGGVPFYLDAIDPERTLNENIDFLIFRKDGGLRREFDRLFDTLFKRKEGHLSVVNALAKTRYGMTRKGLSEATGLAYNGALSEILESLEQCGFVTAYVNYGERKEERYYLSDFFSQFYLRFVRGKRGLDEHFWSNSFQSPSRRAYEGIAFEFICLAHVAQIKESLSIGGVLAEEFAWKARGEDEKAGTQIDLVISRKDSTATICEMKFSETEFTIDKGYDETLRNKVARYGEFSEHRKSIQLVLITTYGLKKNIYSNLVSRVLTLDDLFK